jgi:anti-sigma28 factor (negative regulator of flagellin synthesis)
MQSGTERSQKVQSLQESVNNGEYTVNAAKIADAMTTVIY